MPFFARWHFSDLNDLFREMEEMMEREFRELPRKVPKDLVRERTLPYGRRVKQWDPFVYGYSVTIGARAFTFVDVF